jgi:predicted dehydrogenase
MRRQDEKYELTRDFSKASFREPMKPIRTAVIGTGYLGHFHAEKFASLPESALVAVVDTRADRAQACATRLGVRALTDFHTLVGEVDAVSIAVPTTLHHEIARFFLTQGIHVLVEKPITTTLEQADELITLARDQGLVLQVGHSERFNAVLQALDQVLIQPLFIESLRISPFRPRGTDVCVVLDLMIHDIDIIQHLVRSPIEHIDASGVRVLSEGTDIANARIRFENGCVANVTASRVSSHAERRMRIFQPSKYFSLDFQNRVLRSHTTGAVESGSNVPEILVQEQAFDANDSLLLQAGAFLRAVRTGCRPVVSGEDGRNALRTAADINRQLQVNGHRVMS